MISMRTITLAAFVCFILPVFVTAFVLMAK